MILTTTAILALFFLFTGLGLLFPFSPYRKEPNLHNFLLSFWAGWAIAIGFLQVWHLFYRVESLAFFCLLAGGLAGWVVSWRTIRIHISSWNMPHALLLAGLGILPAAMLANHVMFIPFNFNMDHGLYHMAAVKWISQYAIIPGLGNLHHRLAFNNANFLYTAALDWGILEGRSYYVSNTLLVYVLGLICALNFYQLFQTITTSRLYYALLIPILIDYATGGTLAGYSPDIPIFILQTLLAGEFLRLYETAWDSDTYYQKGALLVLLSAAGITIKLSFAAFGLLMILAVLILWIVRFRQPLRLVLPRWLVWAGIGLALVAPWLIRSVLWSGYPFFPSTQFPLPVAWRMPIEFVEPIQPVIKHWARTASSKIIDTGDMDWFSAWWGLLPFVVRQALVLTLAAALGNLLLFGLLRRKAAQQKQRFAPHWGAVTLFIISALSLVYWFALAPSYRFSGAAFWLLLVSVILLGFRLLTASEIVKNPLRLACGLLLVLSLWLSPNHFSNNLSRKLLLIPPAEFELAEAYQSQTTAQTQHTTSGLTVYLPPGDACLHLPLPCTPSSDFIHSLTLFDSHDLQKGFFLRR